MRTQANFHCLDEFDVFMDSINRGVRLPLLIVCHARLRCRHHPFALLCGCMLAHV